MYVQFSYRSKKGFKATTDSLVAKAKLEKLTSISVIGITDVADVPTETLAIVKSLGFDNPQQAKRTNGTVFGINFHKAGRSNLDEFATVFAELS